LHDVLFRVTVLNILSGQTVSSELQAEHVEGACEEEHSTAGDNIAFTVLSKKGNKQQVIVPLIVGFIYFLFIYSYLFICYLFLGLFICVFCNLTLRVRGSSSL